MDQAGPCIYRSWLNPPTSQPLSLLSFDLELSILPLYIVRLFFYLWQSGFPPDLQ
jgi:hypothetical protein